MSGHRAIGPAVGPAPSQSPRADASRDACDGSAGPRPEPAQRDFNRDLAMAVRAALTGRPGGSGALDFSPDLDPLISQYGARSHTPTKPSEVPEVTLAPVAEPAEPTPAGPASSQSNTSEVRTSPSALQSLLLAMVSPASELTPEAPAEFPLPQQSVQSAPINALKSDLNNSERRALSSALRFPPAGDHGHSFPTMDNTILSADKVMRVADDAMRATDASATSNVATQTPLDVGPQSPLYSRLRPALILALLVAAGVVLFMWLGPRNLTVGVSPNRDAGPQLSVQSLSEAPLQEPAVAAAPGGTETSIPAADKTVASDQPATVPPVTEAQPDRQHLPTSRRTKLTRRPAPRRLRARHR